MPETISDTRKRLAGHVARFRAEGLDAAPVVFGDHRQPEAALLPFETFQLLWSVAEELAVAQRIRECEASDTGNRTSLAEVAAEFDIDLDGL